MIEGVASLHSQTAVGTKLYSRIVETAIVILKALGDVLRFPIRYFGAKNWSMPGVILRTPVILFRSIFFNEGIAAEKFFPHAYDTTLGEELSVEQTREFIRYASFGLVSFAYDEKSWTEPYGARIVNPNALGLGALPGEIEFREKALFDRSNLFKVVILEDENEIIASFGSMHSHWHDYSKEEAKAIGHGQLGSVIANLAGLNTLGYDQADKVVEQLKSVAARKNKTLVLTGQSLGGSYAAYAGALHEVKTVAVNAVQLGAGLQEKLTQEKLDQAPRHVDHITVEGELLTLHYFDVVDRILSFIGVRTPGNFGRRFKLNSYTPSPFDSHDHSMKSFMRKLQYDVKTHVNELGVVDIVKSRSNHA